MGVELEVKEMRREMMNYEVKNNDEVIDTAWVKEWLRRRRR